MVRNFRKNVVATFKIMQLCNSDAKVNMQNETKNASIRMKQEFKMQLSMLSQFQLTVQQLNSSKTIPMATMVMYTKGFPKVVD